MKSFDQVARALRYIDEHLQDAPSVESVAAELYVSPFHFHRMFSAIVGRSMAAYIRARRLERAAFMIAATGQTLTEIAMACGFGTSQSFSRAFMRAYAVSPTSFRRRGERAAFEPVEKIIMGFANRIQGGMIIVPNMIKRGKLLVAGVTGDGNRTGDVWQAFEAVEQAVSDRLSDNGYEIRIYRDGESQCHVGHAVRAKKGNERFQLMELPASEYASFDVFVAEGYMSQNDAMDEWLKNNPSGYRQRKLGGHPYVVEFYDERFHGDEAGSIVEIWLPVERDETP